MFNGVGGGLVNVYEETKFQSRPKRRGAGLGGEQRTWGTWPRLGKTLKADNVPPASCRWHKHGGVDWEALLQHVDPLAGTRNWGDGEKAWEVKYKCEELSLDPQTGQFTAVILTLLP